MHRHEGAEQTPSGLSDGNHVAAAAFDELLPQAYEELKRLAAGYLRRERRDHTLQPTALVHEAYLRLIDQTRVSWQNRGHFFGVAAQVMRRILVDHARAHNAGKRRHECVELQPDESPECAIEVSPRMLRLDEALRDLSKIDRRKALLVELRYFGGLTFEEAAEVLGVSPASAKRHWRLAKAFLYGQLYDA